MKSYVIPDEPGPDFRANAFVGAWDRIHGAQALKVDADGRPLDVLPELYWATLLEADVLARLATADEDPGRDAGAHLVDRQARIAAQLIRDNLGADVEHQGDEPPHPLLTLLDKHVRVNAGDFKSRCGVVSAVYPTNNPPIVDVELDPPGRPDDPAEPITVTVLPSQIDDQGVN